MQRMARVACARSGALAVVLVVLGGAAAGCGGEEVGRSVDATVTLDLPESLPVGSPLDIGYEWTPATSFTAPADDYRVFVHVVDPNGNILAQDDHFPPVPTSQWEAGEPIAYRHWMYLDPDLRPDYLDFFVGLYQGDEQIATLREGRLEARPLVHTTIIRADDQGGLPVYVEGWNEREISPTADIHLRSWQWMRERGVVAFGNPRGPATLHLRARSPVDFIEGPQTVTVKVGDAVVATFEVPDSVPFLRRIDVPAEGMGDGDWIEVVLEVNDTFVPAEADAESDDTRVLGLQIFSLYLER